MLKVYTNHPIVFTDTYTLDNLNSLNFDFVFYLIYDCDRADRVCDVDHILPKNILETLGFTPDKINDIKNFQLLDYGTNRGEKNGKPFKDWVNTSVTNKSAYLKMHLIPSDEKLWEESKLLDFKEKRGQMILDKINLFCK